MRLFSLFFALFLIGCTPVEEQVESPEPMLMMKEEPTTCGSIARAWCEHHIKCGSVDNNIAECMELISWLYCGSDFQVENPSYGAACYHDLTTSECDSWEMSWPGSCYNALGIEEGC